MRRPNLFDVFLVLLIMLAALSVYFTFVQPIHFSKLIKREGVMRYGEVEILLPPDLAWLKQALPVGEESRNVYGELDWKILGFEEQKLGGERLVKVRAKLLITQESSGLLRYGKYTLVKGSKIFLINDTYFIEGRIFNFRVLEEVIQL